MELNRRFDFANIEQNGDGSRVTISIGYSREVPRTGIWIKPSVTIEETVPEGMTLEEFTEELFDYVADKVNEARDLNMALAGLKVKE